MEENKDNLENRNEEEQTQKEPAGNQADQKEDYSFMQEVIKDEPGSRQRRRKDIVRMIGFGIIIGVVACLTFCLLRPWMENLINHEDPETVTIPSDEEETAQASEEEPEPPQEDEPLNADSYTQMLQSLQEVASETSKSVVAVTGYTGEENWAEEEEAAKLSVSGVIVADNGQEVLVLGQEARGEDIEDIQVTFVDGRSYPAAVKGRDGNLGLSIYAVSKEDIEEETQANIQEASLGNSNHTELGDTAIVLGKPFGYADAVSYGIVASVDNYLETADGKFELVYTYVAGSDEGSGVITNIEGEIVGIIDQSVSDEEGSSQIIGYGISGLKDVIQMLSNGEPVPYTGVVGIDVTKEMGEEGIPNGVYVRETDMDSPAMDAGIQSGDVITSLGDVDVASVAGYRHALLQLTVGSDVTLTAMRPGAGDEYVEIEFTVTIGEKE